MMRLPYPGLLLSLLSACSLAVSLDDLSQSSPSPAQTQGGEAGSGGSAGGTSSGGSVSVAGKGGSAGTQSGGAQSGGQGGTGGFSGSETSGSSGQSGGAGQSGAAGQENGGEAGAAGEGGQGGSNAGNSGNGGNGGNGGNSGAGQGGDAGSGGVDSSCPGNAPIALHTLESGKTIASFGASEKGFAYKEGGSPLYVTRMPLLDSAETGVIQGSGAPPAPRLHVVGEQVFGIVGTQLVSFQLNGSYVCQNTNGTLDPQHGLPCPDGSIPNYLSVPASGNDFAVANPCNVQIIIHKNGCNGPHVWVQYDDANPHLGQANEVRGFATNGSGDVWSLERPKSGQPLQIKHKSYDFATGNAYTGEEVLATVEDTLDARELVLDAGKLYTVFHDQASGTFSIVSHSASTPGGPTVLADNLADVGQFAVRGGSLYWVEVGFSTQRIWTQSGGKRKVLACVPSQTPLGGLTITPTSAVWYTQGVPEKALATIYALEL